MYQESQELQEIIEGCKRNDRKFQEKLYHMFYNRLYKYIYSRCEDETISEEIVSSSFLRVFKKIDQYKYLGSFEGWMKTICSRQISDYFVSQKSKVSLVLCETLPERSESIDGSKMRVKEIMSYVNQLPSKTREVFELFLTGLSHIEIGQMLNISEGTSKWHVHNGRKILQPLIER